jgi:succinate-acetate transporter protein
MRKLAKTFFFVAVISFLLFWITYGLLMAALPHIGLEQFLGFEPTSSLTRSQNFLVYFFAILGMPMSIMLHGVNINNMFQIVFLSLLNSAIWGLCLGLPIFAVIKRFHSRVAKLK